MSIYKNAPNKCTYIKCRFFWIRQEPTKNRFDRRTDKTIPWYLVEVYVNFVPIFRLISPHFSLFVILRVRLCISLQYTRSAGARPDSWFAFKPLSQAQQSPRTAYSILTRQEKNCNDGKRRMHYPNAGSGRGGQESPHNPVEAVVVQRRHGN